MAESSLPFAATLLATEAQWRAFFGPTLGDGVVIGDLLQLQVFGDAISGMAVKVRTGRARVRGQFYENSAEMTVAIAANASGNPRIDRVVLRNTFGTSILVAVIQGTPAGSPTAPALTQNTAIWEISLAQVAVANGASSLAASTVTDERIFVPNFTRSVPRAKALAGSQSISNNTLTAIAFASSDIYDTDTMHDTSTNNTRITFNTSGLYALVGYGRYVSNSTGVRQLFFRRTRGGSPFTLPETAGPAAVVGDPTRMNLTAYHEFLVGDYLELTTLHQAGASLSLDEASLSAVWQSQ